MGVYHKQPYSSQGQPTACPDVRNRALKVEMDKEAQQWETQCQALAWRYDSCLTEEQTCMLSITRTKNPGATKGIQTKFLFVGNNSAPTLTSLCSSYWGKDACVMEVVSEMYEKLTIGGCMDGLCKQSKHMQ